MLGTLLGVILDMALPAPITLRTGYNQESDVICTVAITHTKVHQLPGLT